MRSKSKKSKCHTVTVRLPLVFGPQHLYKVESGFTQIPWDFEVKHFADLLEEHYDGLVEWHVRAGERGGTAQSA